MTQCVTDEAHWWDQRATINDIHGLPAYNVDTVVDRLIRSHHWLDLNKDVLDVGCGVGRTARNLARRAGDRATIHGIDISLRNIRTAALESPANTKWRHCDGRKLPSQLPRRFSFAYSITVFQHIPIEATWDYLREIHGRLTDDGSILFTISVGDEPASFLNHQIADPRGFAVDLAGLYGAVTLDGGPDENGWTWVQAWK